MCYSKRKTIFATIPHGNKKAFSISGKGLLNLLLFFKRLCCKRQL